MTDEGCKSSRCDCAKKTKHKINNALLFRTFFSLPLISRRIHSMILDSLVCSFHPSSFAFCLVIHFPLVRIIQ